MTLSILIPVFNGSATIGPLVDRLVGILTDGALQIVLVNDGSADQSHAACLALHARYPETITYLNLAKNFGEHNAVMAGLRHVRGDYVVIMDDDFQNPPEEINRLVEHAQKGGHDVVYTAYATKQHHWFRNLGSRFNDRVATFMLGKPRDLYLSSFKCINRFLVGEIIKYTGPYPYIDGLILRSTRNIGTVVVRHDPREEGRSNYTLRRLVRLWLNMFVNFSVMPLRVSAIMGLIFSGLAFVAGAWVLIDKLLHPHIQVGWPSLMVTIVFFSGVQLAMLGLAGEYLGRLFLASNQTPQFVIREILDTSSACSDTPPRTVQPVPAPERETIAHG
jgi:undecaprenyl-phosphate 4-deoxy-4-formamido-L-arabinose transferase